MKLPAVAIAAAFAGGILLGGLHLLQWLERPSLLVTLVAATFVLLVLGFVLTWRGAIWSASGVSLAGWLALGILAALIAGRPLPSKHVLSRFAANQIPQHTPLRWHGVLRDEPARLPWGYGMDISLTGVETADGYVSTAGGMRLGFTPRDGDTALPELHADEIAALTGARLPLVGATRQQELHNGGIAERGRAANLHHFGRRSEPVCPSKAGVVAAIGRKWHTDLPYGSRRSSACVNRWRKS